MMCYAHTPSGEATTWQQKMGSCPQVPGSGWDAQGTCWGNEPACCGRHAGLVSCWQRVWSFLAVGPRVVKQVDIHSRGRKCQAWLGPLARRFLTYVKETKKCGLTVLWKADKCSLEEGRSCTRWVSGAWSPGREEEKGRPGRRAMGGRPLGAPSCLLWLGTQRERGWGGRPWPLCRGRTTDLKRLLCLMNCSL